jgi:hypothetical protein
MNKFDTMGSPERDSPFSFSLKKTFVFTNDTSLRQIITIYSQYYDESKIEQ